MSVSKPRVEQISAEGDTDLSIALGPSVFYDIDYSKPPPPAPGPHGIFCTEECRNNSRLCHLARRRRKPPAPEVSCPHCGVGPGSPCRAMTSDMRRLTRSYQECHPSRLEVA